ncbi:hypothetical protein ACI3KW_14690 [Devosia sp. ZW T5_3]|uniref:hypothetical protein n=1 Tax=Devosia sp. ZW T5_3 TaxID=3378085 RepID=UPI000DDD0231
MSEAARRFPWAAYWIVWAVILFLTILPLLSVLLAAAIADAHGCRLDEGNAHPCIVWGSDWGTTLYAMALMGWLMIASLPLGGGAFIVWLVLLIIHRLAWGRAAKESKP